MSSPNQKTADKPMESIERDSPAPDSGARASRLNVKYPMRLSDVGRNTPSKSSGNLSLVGLLTRSKPTVAANGTGPSKVFKRRYRSVSLFNDTGNNDHYTPKRGRHNRAVSPRGNIRDYANVPYFKKPALTNDAHPLMTTGQLFRPRTRSDSITKIQKTAQRYLQAENFLTPVGKANFESLLTEPYAGFEDVAIGWSRNYVKMVEDFLGEKERMMWCKETLEKGRGRGVGNFVNRNENCFWEKDI